MAYCKKFLVLKELIKGYSVSGKTVSGIVRAECEGSVTSINLSLIGFSALTDGKYYAVIGFPDGEKFVFDLGASPVTFFTEVNVPLKDSGFSCLISHIADDVTPVAFGTFENTGISANRLAESLNFEIEKQKTVKTARAETTDIPIQTLTYDDETVATENYYLFDKKDGEDEQSILAENLGADTQGKNEKFGQKEETEMFTDETRSSFFQENYYLKIKDDLDKLFDTMPLDTSLNKSLPSSKWVRINYSNDNYYVVGVIYKDDAPEYVCYGVPAKYSEKPPKELDGICSFIPVSVFEMRGDGFWIIFQDANTGKCVTIKNDRP